MIQKSYSWAYIQRKTVLKDTCIPVFTAALFTIAKTKKQLKCHNRRMDKEDVIHIYVCVCVCVYIYIHIYIYVYIYIYNVILAIEKNEIMPFAATWWPGDYHTKWNKTDKDKYHMLSLTCQILKTWGKFTYLWNRSRLNRFKEWTYGHGWGRQREWIDFEFGIDM